MSLGLPSSAQIIDKVTGIVTSTWLGWMQKIDNALVIRGTLTDGHIIVSDGGNYGSDGGVPVSGIVTTTGSPASGNLTKFSGATTITNADLTGDVTTSGAVATTIATNAVSNAKFRQSVATSVVGRSANSTGNVADIASSVENHMLVRRSSVLGFTLAQSIGYWSPLTNGSTVTPELIFDSFGDTIAVWTAL